jgi:hypothetical protein
MFFAAGLAKQAVRRRTGVVPTDLWSEHVSDWRQACDNLLPQRNRRMAFPGGLAVSLISAASGS